jgi:hypothetical protein
MGSKQSRSASRTFTNDEAEDELGKAPEQATTHQTAASSGEQQGISNHPAEEEEEQQAKLPPRGQANE